MDYFITLIIGALAGFVTGILVYRKHAEKLRAAEKVARDAADSLR